MNTYQATREVQYDLTSFYLVVIYAAKCPSRYSGEKPIGISNRLLNFRLSYEIVGKQQRLFHFKLFPLIKQLN